MSPAAEPRWAQRSLTLLNGISADGRYVTFQSTATDLVSGDTNGVQDIFVRDRQTGVTSLVSRDGEGIQPNGACNIPSISADGCSVAFDSSASNLVSGDTNGAADVFAVSLGWKTSIVGFSPTCASTAGGTTLTVSGWDFFGVSGVTVDGASASGISVAGSTRLSFTAPAHARGTALVRVTGTYGESAGDPSGAYVTYVDAPAVTALSVTNGPSAGGTTVVITGEDFAGVAGVAFGGRAAASYTVDSATQITAVTPAHGGGLVQVKVTTTAGSSADTAADDFTFVAPPNFTERVNVTSAGAQARGSDFPDFACSVSGDGRYVAFISGASSLVANDTNQAGDVFVRDRFEGVTTRVSVSSSGVQANSQSYEPPSALMAGM